MKKMILVAVVSAVVGGFATNALAERQPHMRNALGLLENAKKQLQAASSDKGGHRVKAIEHVDAAIEQVKKGIEFDNKN